MAENSLIAWTTHTFNPWRGCAKVSAGCKHCYAEQLVTKRQGLPLWGVGAERKIAAESTWKEPRRWNRLAAQAGERHRVFCSSLADVFEPRTDLADARRRLFRLIEETPHLDWLLLTKRPESMAQLAVEAGWLGEWPANVWAGTTVEHQAAAEERIPHLLRVPARVRFLSCEPMLEEVDLFQRIGGTLWIGGQRGCNEKHRGNGSPGCPRELHHHHDDRCGRGLDWVICGGESGHHARPFGLAWARSLLDQCAASDVPFFMKQVGAVAFEGPTRYRTKHPKGGDPAEWPLDLQIQELPS